MTVARSATYALLIGVMALGISGCRPRFSCSKVRPADSWAVSSATGGMGSAPTVQSDPQDAQVAINPACSTYCYEQDGEGWQAPVFGTVELTIDPLCTGPTCTLTMSKLRLTTGDLSVDGHTVSQVEIWSLNRAMGFWQHNKDYVLARSNAYIYTGFTMDGASFGQGFTNHSDILSGTLDSDYEEFTLTGSLRRGDWAAVSFDLCGHPVARPPVPVVTPTGIIQTDSPGVAHVNFSSAQSHDPDDDIESIEWRLDGAYANAVIPDTLPTILTVGTHTVTVKVRDSRGVSRTASSTVSVVEAM